MRPFADRYLRLSPRWDLPALLVLSLAVLLPGLGQHATMRGREFLHAEISREMVTSDTLAVPTRLGGSYVNKPPIAHAMATVFFRIAGERSLFLARLPSALAGAAGVLATYGIAWLVLGRRGALLAAVGVLATPAYAAHARTIRPDMVFAATLFLSCCGIGWGMAVRGRARQVALFLAAGVAAGISTVTKGPYGILFPALFVGLFPIGRPELRRPRLLGVAMLLVGLAAGIALWLVPAYLHDGGQYVSEVLGGRDLEAGEGHQNPVWFYLAGPFFWETLPMVALLPLAIALWRRQGPSGSLAMALSILAILTAMGNKRSYYLLPIVPYLSVAMAEAFLAYAPRWPKLVPAAWIVLPVCLLGTPVAYGVVLPLKMVDPEWEFATEVASRVGPEGRIVCLSGRSESVAWVADRTSGIADVYNPETAAAKLREWGPGTHLTATRADGEAVRELLGGSLEPVYESDREKRRWSLYRVAGTD